MPSIGAFYRVVLFINPLRPPREITFTRMEVIVNKVAESGLVTLDLSTFIPDAVATFDLKPYLFREMILREKDYRSALASTDWTAFEKKHVAITCSVDAIIPVWAYMLAASYLEAVALSVFYGTEAEMVSRIVVERIENIDTSAYTDKRVVLKGCGDTVIPTAAYVAATTTLKPVVKSLMYGEPCSTVPVFKRK